MAPDNGLAHYLLSIIYRVTMQFKEAAEELSFVTRYYPGFKNALFELGETYFAIKNYKTAKTFVIRYLKEITNDKEARAVLEELKTMGY